MRWSGLRQRAQELHDNTDYAIVGSCFLGGGIIEQTAWLRGMEESLMDLVEHPAFAEALMEGITELHIETARYFLDVVGDYLDVLVYWDDLAAQ